MDFLRTIYGVTFIVANLAGDGQAIKWEVRRTTLGVEDYSTNAGALSITGMAPNPAQNITRINFRTRTAGQITMDMYDMQGQVVQRVLDGEHFEGGEHRAQVDVSGLPGGVYTVHMTDEAGAISVRQIVVVK